MNYAEAKGKILPPKASNLDYEVKNNRVWFVVFEGRWRWIGGPLPPEPTQTSTLISTVLPTPTPTLTPTPSPGCIFVLFFGSERSEGLKVSGIKNCEQWKANQNIDSHFDLDGTRWILQSMHGKEMLEDTTITLKFEGREITGSTTCNYYWKVLSPQPEDEITFRITVQLCHDPEGIMEQEDQYVSALKQWASYHVEGENLFVMDESGNILLQYQSLPKFDSNPDD